MTIYAGYAVLTAQANAQQRIREIRQLNDDRRALQQWRGDDDGGHVSFGRVNQRNDNREQAERVRMMDEDLSSRLERVSYQSDELDERDNRYYHNQQPDYDAELEARIDSNQRRQMEDVDRRLIVERNEDRDARIGRLQVNDGQSVGYIRGDNRINERLEDRRLLNDRSEELLRVDRLDYRTDIDDQLQSRNGDRLRVRNRLIEGENSIRRIEKDDSRNGENISMFDKINNYDGFFNVTNLIALLSAALMVSTNKQTLQQLNEMVRKIIF